MGRSKGVIRQIAEELDVDSKTVRRALEAAGLTQEQAGANFAAAVDAVRPFVDKERVIGHQATRVTTNPAIADARRRLEELKARELEIEIAKAEGRLIDRQAVMETGARIIGTVRTGLLSFGFRVADKLIGKLDAGEIARIVNGEISTMLMELSDIDRFMAALDAEALG